MNLKKFCQKSFNEPGGLYMLQNLSKSQVESGAKAPIIACDFRLKTSNVKFNGKRYGEEDVSLNTFHSCKNTYPYFRLKYN